MAHRLTFDELQRACVERDKTYRNARGELNDCADWTESDWLSALIGEIGEACNILKKVRRGDLTLDEAREAIGEEMGDAQTYLVKWCVKLGIDLGQVTFEKFNKVSRKVGSPTLLPLPVMRDSYSLTSKAQQVLERDSIEKHCKWPAGAARENSCAWPTCRCGTVPAYSERVCRCPRCHEIHDLTRPCL